MDTEEYKNFWTQKDKILMVPLIFFSLFFGALFTFLGYDFFGFKEYSIILIIVAIILISYYTKWAINYREEFLRMRSLADLYHEQKIYRYLIFFVITAGITSAVISKFFGEALHNAFPYLFWLTSEKIEAFLAPLFFPIFYVILYYRLLSTNGEIRIEFEQLISTWDSFRERQKWMVKIFKRLETSLRIGFINISHHDLCYHANINNKKIDEIQEDLEGVKNWLLKKENNAEILNYIKNISPKIEFQRLRVRPRLYIFKAIGNNEKYFGYLTFIILVIIQQKSLVAILQELAKILL